MKPVHSQCECEGKLVVIGHRFPCPAYLREFSSDSLPILRVPFDQSQIVGGVASLSTTHVSNSSTTERRSRFPLAGVVPALHSEPHETSSRLRNRVQVQGDEALHRSRRPEPADVRIPPDCLHAAAAPPYYTRPRAFPPVGLSLPVSPGPAHN